MEVLEISQEMDRLIVLYIKGEDCIRQMEEQRKKLNNAMEKMTQEE